jgi:hypothetical protein
MLFFMSIQNYLNMSYVASYVTQLYRCMDKKNVGALTIAFLVLLFFICLLLFLFAVSCRADLGTTGKLSYIPATHKPDYVGKE